MPPARQQRRSGRAAGGRGSACSPARRAGRWRPASTCGRAGRRTCAPAARATRAWRSSWASSVLAHAREPAGQLVADALELAEREQPRAGGERARRGGWGRCQARAGVQAGADELALEAPDLLAQRAARGALVDLRDGRPARGRARAARSVPLVRTPSMDRFPAYHRVCRPRAPRILPLRPMPRNDPTDTGGLFIGRRPGTAPLRYKADPSRAGERPPPDRRDARRRRARARGARVPDAVGPAAGRVAVGRLPGRLPRRLDHAGAGRDVLRDARRR